MLNDNKIYGSKYIYIYKDEKIVCVQTFDKYYTIHKHEVVHRMSNLNRLWYMVYLEVIFSFTTPEVSKMQLYKTQNSS